MRNFTLTPIMCLWLSLPSVAFAQGSPPLPLLESQDSQRRELQRRFLEQGERDRERAKPGLSIPSVPIEAVDGAEPEPDRCVDVHRVEWVALNPALTESGAQQSSISVLNRVIQRRSWLQQLPDCLSAAGIERRIEQLNVQLQANGFITSLVLPARPILSGQSLRLSWVIGRIESYRMPDGLPPSLHKAAFPAVGSVLNLRELEQALDTVNRLASYRLRLSLQPGSRTGATIVDLQLERSRPWRMSTVLDNSGSHALSPLRWHLRSSWDTPFALPIFTQLSAGGDWESRGDDAAYDSRALHINFAHGPWHWDWDIQRSKSSQRLPDIPQRVLSQSQHHNQQLRLSRLWHRDANWIVRSALKIEHGKDRYTVAGQKLGHSGAHSAMAAELSLLYYGSRGYWQSRLERQWGQSWWGADSDPDSDSFGEGPDPGYRRWRLQFSTLQRLGDQWQWRAQALWQSSEDSLPSAQQMALGGDGSIRSYDTALLSGDRGGWLQQSFYRHVGTELPWRVAWHWDWGRIKDRQSGWASASSAGMELSLRQDQDTWQWGYHHRLHGPDNSVNDHDQWTLRWQRHWLASD